LQKRLSEAIQAQDAAAVRAAIAAGADLNEPYKHSMGTNHSLQLAVRNPTILRILLENGADPNGVDTPNNSNALAYAAFNGQAESAAALLAAGTDPNHVDLMGFTPLGHAAMKGTDEVIEVMRALLDGGADIEAGIGSTPLMMASRSRAAIRFLLDRGANPNATRPTQGTALHVCIDDKNIAGIELLLSRGADPTIPGPTIGSKPGLTALEFAKKKKVKKAIEILEGNAKPATAPTVDLRAILDILLTKKSYAWLPPATEKEIAELAAFVGTPLPPALLSIYRRANGQKPTARKPLCPPADFLDGGWFLSPISEVIADGMMLTELLDKGEFDGQKKKVMPDNEVRKEWWDRHWLPILADGGGDHVCLDFNPSPSGKVGQVIEFRHDSGERKLLHESLDGYLGDLESQ
jgi:ankyrin repeat protein/cell wall assembly regulator SMI1